MSTVFVTGVNGFVGKHLAAELVGQKHKVVGVGRETELHPLLQPLVSEYFVCELSDQASVDQVPWEKADCIISLAGLAAVGKSFDDPDIYKRINVAVLSTICSYLESHSLKTNLVAISTGAVYDSHQPLPLTEESALNREGSPYALSKIMMEEAAAEFQKRGVNCVVVRPFNHVGPGQEPGFLVPDLYVKIIESLKTGEPVRVGNLHTRRDYSDVRDVVRAYTQLATAKPGTLHHGLYNVCSGSTHSGEEILAELKVNIPGSEKLEFVADAALMRPNDPEEIFGSRQKLTDDIGWNPGIDFKTTIKDFVDGH